MNEEGEIFIFIFLYIIFLYMAENKENLQDKRKLSRNKLKFGEESFEIIKRFLYDKGKG